MELGQKMSNSIAEAHDLTSDELLAIVVSGMQSGMPIETIPLLRSLIQRDNSNGRAHYLLAVEQSVIGLLDEADKSFSCAIEHCPELTEARIQYAMLLIALGKNSKAKMVLQGYVHAPQSVAGDCCQILIKLASGDLGHLQTMLESLTVVNEADRPTVQLVGTFVEEHIQRALEDEANLESRFMGRYARLERPH